MQEFFTSIGLPGVTLLDVVLLAVFLFYAYEGYTVGFVVALLDVLSFVFSFILGLKFYGIFGHALSEFFSAPSGLSNAIGFFLVACIAELILGLLFRHVAPYFSKLFFSSIEEGEQDPWVVRFYHIAGIIPGVLSAFVLLTFLLTLIIALPLSPFLKKAVAQSYIGSTLVANTQGLEQNMNDVFSGAITETMNFLTVKPESNQSVTLHFKTTQVSADSEAEQAMFALVNSARVAHGLEPLVFDTKLRDVGRDHAKDMFARGYFSHFTPEGFSPFDRMDKKNILYSEAGENLALAPNTQLAMQGLMQSPGHRANILSPKFHAVGIGVIDGGIYGEMFTQEFTD